MTPSSQANQARSTDLSPSMTTRTLVTSLIGDDGALDAAEAYGVAEAIGFSYHQVRLCLARLVREGVLEQSGRGRKAMFRATDEGWRTMAAEPGLLALAFDQDLGTHPWDRRWHIVTFDFDDEQRSERNALREFLRRLGAGALIRGVYVSPHDWRSDVLAEAQRLGVADQAITSVATELVVGTASSPFEVAARVWPVEQTGLRWGAFLSAWRPTARSIVRKATAATETDPVALAAMVVQISTAFDALMRDDPLLPPELLPRNWPGTAARHLMLDIDEACAPFVESPSGWGIFKRYDDVLRRARRQRELVRQRA